MHIQKKNIEGLSKGVYRGNNHQNQENRMKIDEIEELNAERTQGGWEKLGNDVVDKADNNNMHASICKMTRISDYISNQDFIAAAPTITEQYIKARRFRLNKEMQKNILTRLGEVITESTIKGYKEIMDDPFGITKIVLEMIWEEIENA